jgi:vacuolar iron transporter family protein
LIQSVYPSGHPLLTTVDEESFGGYDPSEDIGHQVSPIYHTFSGTSSEATAIQDNSRPTIDPRIISDAILGLSDGLTVPFALSAGLSALGDTKVVVLGGLAELAAGAISMGLGGYVGAKSER